MDRKTARAHAMKLIYEWEMGGDGGEDTRLNLLEVEPGENEAEYMNRMFSGVVEHAKEIDEKITAFARGWSLERITRVDLAILRLGTYELMLGEIPSGVIVNEAVELAKGFGGEDDSPRFVNGVLGRIARSMEGDGAVAADAVGADIAAAGPVDALVGASGAAACVQVGV